MANGVTPENGAKISCENNNTFKMAGTFEGRKPRVLFTFVEAGFGHIMPMQAIFDAFKAKYGDRCECLPVNIFSESPHPAVIQMGKEFYGSTKLASKNWLFNKIEGLAHHFSTRFTHWFLDLHFKKAERLSAEEIKALNPDLVVATYYMPTHICAKANAKKIMNVLTATYSPDPYIYPAWDRNCDIFFVNNKKAYDMAVKKGFKKDKVKLIPCLLRKGIREIKLTKEEAREAVGLNKDRFNVVFTSGAYGEKRTNALLKSLATSNLDFDLTVICGKNPDTEKAIREYEKIKSPSVGINVVPYTDKMAEYMRAADIVMGKSGSNTIMEAAYLSANMLISARASHLEEIAADWAVDEKIALCETKPEKIIEIIKNCIEDPDYMKNRLTGLDNYSDLNGAEIAADELYRLLKTRYPEL